MTGSTPFVIIPGGWFLMGSEEGQEDERPMHRVWVDPFNMAVYPVTRRQYTQFITETGRATPCGWDDPVFAEANQPVVGVSWTDAYLYCVWCSSKSELIRLPTEAEWERAARGDQPSGRYPWGDAIPAWIPNGGKGPLQGPWPVTLGDPNPFGLYGITADIHEWCADWHSKTFYSDSPARNPVGPPDGVRRISRGGSWRHSVTISRSAARSKLDPSFRYTDYGFRVVQSHPGESQD